MPVKKYYKYSAMYDVLNDPKSAFNLEQEQLYDVIEEVKNNSFRGKKRYDGKVIEPPVELSEGNSSVPSSDTKNKKVFFTKMRMDDIEDNILENPDDIVDPSMKNLFKSMHKTAVFSPSDGQNLVTFAPGDTVECKYSIRGPNSNGGQRGLQLTDNVKSRESGNYKYTSAPASSAFATSTPQTLGQIDPAIDPAIMAKWDLKWKDVIIQGSVWPDHPIKTNMNVKPNKHIRERYLPAAKKVFASDPKGFLLLATAMAIKEGYYPNTRAYKYNNPGNIGNTDSGKNKSLPSLEDGIQLQRNYITKVASGNHKYYKMNKPRFLKPYYSKEIAKNWRSYKKSPYLPGYKFVYTGQLDQYVKIYATGSRSGNGYLSLIISYFRQNGIIINETSKVQDIIKLN